MIRRENTAAHVSVVEDVNDVVIETTNAATVELDCSSCSSGSTLKLVAGAAAGLVLSMGLIMTLMLGLGM